MKKTLFICGHYPSPEHIGTTMRTMNFVRFFRSMGSVDIAYTRLLPGGRPGNPLFSREYHLESESLNGKFDRIVRWLHMRNRPLPVSRYGEASERRLLSLVERGGYDFIFVRYVINAWSLFKLPSTVRPLTIVDFDDVLSGTLYESDVKDASGMFQKLRLRINLKFLKEYERRCLHLDAALFCSQKDKTHVAGNRDNAFVVPNVYRNEAFEGYDFGSGSDREDVLLFIGTLNYVPNVQGLRWFLETVFPVFKKKYPGAKLFVVGRSPDETVVNLCEGANDVSLFPDVPDVREFYAKCKAVVVPLHAGGGTRIKILEAALAHRPVLSTSVGAEGLDLADGSELLYFEDPHGLCLQYERLRDRRYYASLTQNAARRVSEHYSEAALRKCMETVLRHLGTKNPSEEKSLTGTSDSISRGVA